MKKRLLKTALLAAIVAIGTTVVVLSLPDIKRYLRMRSM